MHKVLKKFGQDIVGLFWAGASLFIGLSLLSYSPADPSLNSLGSKGEVANYCGYLGSFLADLIFQMVGIGGWFLLAGCIFLAHQSFAGMVRPLRLWRAILFLALILNASNLLTFVQQNLVASLPFQGGGAIGLLIHNSLTLLLNKGGVLVVSCTFLFMVLIFFFEKSLAEIFSVPLSALSRVYMMGAHIFSELLTRLYGLNFSPKADSHSLHHDHSDKIKEHRAFPINETKKQEPPRRIFHLLSKDSKIEGDPNPSNLKTSISTSSAEPAKKRKTQLKRRLKTDGNWELPDLDLLETPPKIINQFDEKEAKAKAQLLLDKLAQFSVRADVVGIKPGPAVTLFEVKPAADVKISKITDLADDLALALSCESLRMIAPIPGRDVIGIETSNSQRQNVYLKDVLQDDSFWSDDIKLPIALGRQADGEPQIVDLRKMPHLLVAGTTGSGKSVFVVSSLVGLLLRHSPETLRLVLVDPKQVDLAIFNELPHLLMPPVREPKKAVSALRWAIREMEKRYRSMSKFGARNIELFNETVSALTEEDKEAHQVFLESLNSETHPEAYYLESQPYIVIIVEEFGDLMAVDKVNVEQCVVRLAQMARASGIHLVLAMQSPRRDVVTGLIKTNIPGRISFKVASKTDSRIILDESGAERLLARGDMLFLAPGVSKPLRNHGAYLSEEEISRVVECWKGQGEPEYHPFATKLLNEEISSSDGGFLDSETDEDEIKDERYDEILEYVASQKEMSASLLQRRFRLGYPRAARMMEIFEAEGVVGPAQGSKPRKVLISSFPIVQDKRL